MKENKFRYVLALMHKALNDNILKQVDDQQRNLFHYFAIEGVKGKEFQNKIFHQLHQRGVDFNSIDVFGRTPLHYAAESNFSYLEYELLKLVKDPNTRDHKTLTPLSISLIKGHLTNDKLGRYIDYGVDVTKRFTCEIRDKEIEVGPLVYLASKGTKPDELMTNLIKAGVSINEADDEGWTGLIYSIKQNSKELVDFYFSYQELDKNMVDIDGKTPIHYVVNPLEYGSYENIEILKLLATIFDVNKPDLKDKTPIYYAHLQDSGTMVQALKELGAVDHQAKGTLKRLATSIITSVEWAEEVDYEDDAEKYMKELQEKDMEIVDDTEVEPDDHATNARNLKVLYENNEPYSLYMTKVNVKKGGYGEYLFYRMQVLYEPNRDVYILFTKWGRIGEDGAYQNTPFSNSLACITEFKKIFFEKTRNYWDDKADFKRVEGKYRLLDIETKKLVFRKDYLKPIDFEDKSIPESLLDYETQNLMRSLANINLYKNYLKDLRIDNELLPFGQISKKLIIEAKDILTEISSLIQESRKLCSVPVADIKRDEVIFLIVCIFLITDRS